MLDEFNDVVAAFEESTVLGTISGKGRPGDKSGGDVRVGRLCKSKLVQFLADDVEP
jgi:hypothetical protein